MRYFILTLLLVGFTACGSDSSETPPNTENSTTPVTPEPTDSSKTPPSIPQI